MTDTAGIVVSRKRGYTIVYNDLLPEDGVLSARAWGLYVYLLGRPDGWECRASHLATVFKEGRDAIYSALKELVAVGLMAKQDYIADGLRRSRYTIDADAVPTETRRSAPDTDSQDPGSQEPGIQSPGDPEPENPSPENPGQVSKDSPSTEGASTEVTTPDESGERRDLNAGRDDVDRVCAHLSQRLTERAVRHTVTKGWRDAARLMLDTDGRTEQQVHNMIEWCNPHEFWRSVIHSMPKLREKYDQMREQALRGTDGPSNLHTTPDTPGRQQRLEAWS